jgi:hypothetical protein
MNVELDDILSKLRIDRIVSTRYDTESIISVKLFKINEVRDARSAAFEAFGILKMIENPVAVIVDESELASTLTAATEAWFQRKDLVLVTVNDNFSKHFDYLDRCVVSESLLMKGSNNEMIIHEMQLCHGPHLLRTTIATREDSPIDYSAAFQLLSGYLSTEDVIMLYHPIRIKGANIKAILPQHRYCTVSKYIGNLLGTKERVVLCIPERLLAYDSNIFNFRNLPDLFFLVVLADGCGVMDKLAPWIESNGIRIIQKEGMCDTDTIQDRKPKLVYIKK